MGLVRINATTKRYEHGRRLHQDLVASNETSKRRADPWLRTGVNQHQVQQDGPQIGSEKDPAVDRAQVASSPGPKSPINIRGT